PPPPSEAGPHSAPYASLWNPRSLPRSCNLPFSAASPAAPSLSETHTYPMISTSVILPDHYILLSLPFLTPKYAIVRISVSQGTFLVKKICVNSVCDSVRSAQSP